MRIKVCGMRELENVVELLQLPIDFAGFIFYEKSPRFAENGALRSLLNGQQEMFNGIRKVGVFVNAEIDYVLNRVHDYQLDYVQLHGNESPEYCGEIKSLWEMSSMRSAQLIKAFSINPQFDFACTIAYKAHCAFFLFDTKGVHYGGSGRQFDWNLLEQYQGDTPFLLSGGIDADSAKLIKSLKFPQLFAVDINSRFEIKPGLKDIEKIKNFVGTLNCE